MSLLGGELAEPKQLSVEEVRDAERRAEERRKLVALMEQV